MPARLSGWVFLASFALSPAAGADGVVDVSDHEAVKWRGVGLLTMDDRPWCTGALIGANVVLTAAHCVVDDHSGLTHAPSRLRFYAGYRRGRAVADASAAEIDVHPGYGAAGPVYNERKIRSDLARVILDQPIGGAKAPAYRIGSPAPGGAYALATYGGGRREVGVQSPCGVTSRKTEFVTLNCRSVPGTSGSPIFRLRDGEPSEIVAVVSGSRNRGRRWIMTLGMVLEHAKSWLRASSPGAPPVKAGDPPRFLKAPSVAGFRKPDADDGRSAKGSGDIRFTKPPTSN